MEASDPVGLSADITGGYLNTGTSLILISDKVLLFGSGQEYATTAMPAFYWKKLLISINTSTEAIIITEGDAAVLQSSAAIPDIPANCKPCAIVAVQDDGNAGVGTIQNITFENITDVRAIIE